MNPSEKQTAVNPSDHSVVPSFAEIFRRAEARQPPIVPPGTWAEVKLTPIVDMPDDEGAET